MDRIITHTDPVQALTASPELQLVYETAPIGLAFLSTDCRYLLINQHMTEICGISIAGHLGRSVRETVPQVAEQVEHIVQTILRSGDPITGVESEARGQTDRMWSASGSLIGIH
jgi:PAS domain-containing protein